MLKVLSACRRRTPTIALTANAARRGLLTQAISRGPSEPPLIEQTIGSHFADIVAKHGDRDAVVSRHQSARLTYNALDQDSNALAKGLEDIGVRKGDRVAVSLGNNIEFATITYACFKLGAILVPLNPAFTANQVISALNHLTASHLVIGLETNLPFKPPRSNLELLRQLVPNISSASSSSKIESETVPSLRSLVTVDNAAGRIDQAAVSLSTPIGPLINDNRSSRSNGQRSDLHPNEVVNIQFTSGTTSMPKAAQLTHRSILNNGYYIGERMLLTEQDVVVCPPPLFHCFGCVLGYMATATHGSSIVFPTEAFDPTASLKAVQEERATALYGVPTMFLAELDLLEKGAIEHKGFGRLRTGIAAGTNIPIELMKKLHNKLNLRDLTICYGMTETSPVSCMTTTHDPIEKRTTSVGRVMPNTAVKVVDAHDRNRVLNVGERGELCASGYLVMKGYWGDKEKTDEVLVPDQDPSAIDAEGNRVMWMHTGDEAIMDEEGYVTITGRLKDIIIRGGENIHPLDIENCLLAMDDISDVSCCGVPDERYGEVAACFIISKEGRMPVPEGTVREWVRERLGGHFVPKHVFHIEAFPKTPSGKVQRFKLQKQAVEMLKETS